MTGPQPQQSRPSKKPLSLAQKALLADLALRGGPVDGRALAQEWGVHWSTPYQFLGRVRRAGGWFTAILWGVCACCGQEMAVPARHATCWKTHPRCRREWQARQGADRWRRARPSCPEGDVASVALRLKQGVRRAWERRRQEASARYLGSAETPAQANGTAWRRGEPWVEAEYRYLFDHQDDPVERLAAALGRTVVSIKDRKGRLLWGLTAKVPAATKATQAEATKEQIDTPATGRRALTPLGQGVRTLRQSQGLTQAEVAQRGGVGLSLVIELESGRRKYLRPGDIAALAVGLAIPEDHLWALVPGGKGDGKWISIFG